MMKDLKKVLLGYLVVASLLVVLTGCTSNHTIDLNKDAKPLDTSKTPYKDVLAEWDSLSMEMLVTRAAQQIGKTYRYANKVWPGVDFSQFQVLFIQDSSDSAWLVQPGGSAYIIESKVLPEEYNEVPFYATALEHKLNDKNTSIVRLEADHFDNEEKKLAEFVALPQNTYLFNLVAHEEFHAYQGGWEIKNKQEQLYEAQVGNTNARVYRIHLIESLRQAILQPEKQEGYLSAAKYWLTRYQTEFPEESKLAKDTDIIEGAARYFDMAMAVRSAYVMDISAEEALPVYQAMIEKDYFIQGRHTGMAEQESYDIGGAAGILMEMRGIPGWQQRVEKGEVPVEILLENVTALEQQEDPELTAFVKSVLEAKKSGQE